MALKIVVLLGLMLGEEAWTWTSYQPLFLPGPQFCPDTGRTVCTAVDYYPTDQIFHLLMNSRSQGFNLTSLFVDERHGDPEPNLGQVPTPKPQYYPNGGYDSYNQSPPPGGRFSPAGYNYNQPTSERPPELQPDRWRQVNNPSGPARGSYAPGSRRQSRVQGGMVARRGNVQQNRGSVATQGFNHGRYPANENVNNQYDEQGVNRMQQFGSANFSSRYPQDVPSQIQPPQVHYGVKGQNAYTVGSPASGTWKGSPTNNGGNPNFQENSQTYNNGRRKKRNEDAEVACEVRSAYLPPRAALNDNSEWKYIVNVPERDRRFQQVVKVDICLNAGEPCSSRISLPFGFESRCRQKYIKKKLLSLNPDGQGTSEDNFFIPSCCVCEITRPDGKK